MRLRTLRDFVPPRDLRIADSKPGRATRGWLTRETGGWLKIDQMCVFLKNQRPAEVSSAFSVTPESPTLE